MEFCQEFLGARRSRRSMVQKSRGQAFILSVRMPKRPEGRAPAGVLAADAGGQNGDAGFARRDFPKRRGFFFQGEANERGHDTDELKHSLQRLFCTQRIGISDAPQEFNFFLCVLMTPRNALW